MFHVGMWRERMRNALNELAEGKAPTPPPPIEQLNEFNDAELARGIGTPLTDAAARSDHLIGEIIELYEKVGDRPFTWYLAKTTREAVLRNSYMHPRTHMYGYLRENGEQDRANRLVEDAEAQLHALEAPALVLGAATYNLACVRCNQKRLDDALDLLTEAVQMRPDLKGSACEDSELEPLRDDPRFQDLVKQLGH